MQIEELNKALATLTKEERELMEAIFYKEESLRSISRREKVTDRDTLLEDVAMIHVNLNDGSLEGLQHRTLPVFSVQYHPESATGPHDARYLFARFLGMIRQTR